MVLTIAAAIFVFGLLVLVHELGHFITAKLTGMRVDEFAIGFGPQLVSFTRGETVYSLRAIPLGGFNDIAGMDPSNNEAGDRGYCEKPVFSRMIVILAGSLMNFVLPVIIFFGIFFFVGVSTPNPEPVLGTVLVDKAAAQAGLQEGDRILSLDGKAVGNWTEFVDTIKENDGSPIEVVAQRGEETFSTTMIPVYDAQAKKAMVGVMSSVDVQHPGLFESMGLALQKTAMIVIMMLEALAQIVLKLSGSELAGPIGVAQMAGEVAQLGFVPLLNFAAFLSLNLGIVNLFPIPALDGGHFVTLCVEAVRGKPMSPKALEYTQKVGIVLLLLLMVLATKNDIVRVFTGG